MKLKILLPWIINFVLILLSLPLILPFFHAGYFPTHDGLWAVVRLGDMFREIKDHQFPARYSGNLNFGYGYPLFNFAYPFPYYFGLLFHFAKIPFVTTIKLLFAVTVPLSAIGMYFASTTLWKNRLAGLISAVLYIYLPYRMVDLYVRGSLGESFAFVCFPFIILAIAKIAQQPKNYFWIAFGGLFLAILIMSHNIMALLFFPIIIVVGIIQYFQNKKALIPLLAFFFLGFGIAAFFWIPALLEKKFILLSKLPIADRSISFVSFPQLFFSSWQYGLPGSKDSFTYQLGWGQVIGFLCAVGLLLKSFISKEKDTYRLRLAICYIGLLLLLLCMMFSWSNILWDHIPLFSIIDYPWILLGPIGFLIALIAGYAVAKHSKWVILIVSIGALITIITVTPFAKPEKYLSLSDDYFLTNQATTTSSSEYTPIWVKQLPLTSTLQKVVIPQGSASGLSWNSKIITFTAQASQKTLVTVNTIYYPGWKFTIDGKQTSISYNNMHGVMQFVLPPGNHAVKGVFTETSQRLFADVVSSISLVLFFIFLFLGVKQKSLFSSRNDKKRS